MGRKALGLLTVAAAWAVLAVACDGGSDNAAPTATLRPAATQSSSPVATTVPPGSSPTPTPASQQRPGATVTTPTPASAPVNVASPTPTAPPSLLTSTPSPTPPPTPGVTAVALVSPTPGGAQGVVAAEIVAFSPSGLVEVDVGQSVALSVTVLNTGTEAHRFTASGVVLHGSSGPVGTFQSALSEPLTPGAQRTVQWSHTVDRPGDFFLHYLLLAGDGTLLDQAPATPQKLVVGRELPTATPSASSSGQPPPTPRPTQVAPAASTPTPAPSPSP